MKKLFLIAMILLSLISYSQNTDSSTVEIVDTNQVISEAKFLRNEGIILLSIGAFCHALGATALVNNPFSVNGDSDDVGLFIVQNVTGLALDIVGVVKLCQARKKIKKLTVK